MRRHSFILLALVTALALFGGGAMWWWPRAASVVEEEPAGFPAPAFTWQDFSGQSHALADLAGRVVVLHFWASWCAPCRAEFPQLIAAARAMPEVAFVAISSDSDRAKAEKFLHDFDLGKPPANLFLAWDAKRQITYDLFMTTAYPESILLDRQHRLRRKIPGVAAWQEAEMQDYLQRLSQTK